jgi:hypothetical protein
VPEDGLAVVVLKMLVEPQTGAAAWSRTETGLRQCGREMCKTRNAPVRPEPPWMMTEGPLRGVQPAQFRSVGLDSPVLLQEATQQPPLPSQFAFTQRAPDPSSNSVRLIGPSRRRGLGPSVSMPAFDESHDSRQQRCSDHGVALACQMDKIKSVIAQRDLIIVHDHFDRASA